MAEFVGCGNFIMALLYIYAIIQILDIIHYETICFYPTYVLIIYGKVHDSCAHNDAYTNELLIHYDDDDISHSPAEVDRAYFSIHTFNLVIM